MKKILFKLSGVLCSFAFFVAISTLSSTCISTYHQPTVPKSLEKYREDN